MFFHMSSGTDLVHADWEPIQVPLSYLAGNYPIRYVSLSEDGKQIGVAGRHGCILYNRQTRRWRMFGDLNQEKAITCVGMTWLDNVVIALVSKTPQHAEVRYTFTNSS